MRTEVTVRARELRLGDVLPDGERVAGLRFPQTSLGERVRVSTASGSERELDAGSIIQVHRPAE